MNVSNQVPDGQKGIDLSVSKKMSPRIQSIRRADAAVISARVGSGPCPGRFIFEGGTVTADTLGPVTQLLVFVVSIRVRVWVTPSAARPPCTG